jgi:hypothetical protein
MRRHDTSRHHSRRFLSGLVLTAVVAGYAERRYRASRPAHQTPHAPFAFAPAADGDDVVAEVRPVEQVVAVEHEVAPAPVPAPTLELGDEPVERRQPSPEAWGFVAPVPEVTSFADASTHEPQVEVEADQSWSYEAPAPVEVEATVEHDVVEAAPLSDEVFDEVEAEVEVEVFGELADEPIEEPAPANEHWFGSFAPETPWAPPVEDAGEATETAAEEAPVAEEPELPARPFGGTPVLFGSSAPLELEPPRAEEQAAEADAPTFGDLYDEAPQASVDGEGGDRPFRYPPSGLRRWMGTNLS